MPREPVESAMRMRAAIERPAVLDREHDRIGHVAAAESDRNVEPV